MFTMSEFEVKMGESKAVSEEKEKTGAVSSKGQSAEQIALEVAKRKAAMQVAKLKEQQTIKKENKRSGHKFWNTQPVPQEGEVFEEHGPIDELKTVSDVKQDPYTMPSGFDWVSLDVCDPVQLEEIYTLLTENYVEDDDNMFRFDYSKDFLMWALTPPGYLVEWHAGVRTTSNNKLVALITAVPADIRVHSSCEKMVEINFLCVHKKIRSKRLAPVLIKEITRRVNLQDRWQAVYTAGIVLPKPISRCRYFHRSINPRKLFEIGFSRLGDRAKLSRTVKLMKLPDAPLHKWELMEPGDVPGVTEMLSNYLQRTKLCPVLSHEDVAHWLLPRHGVINSYVIRNKNGEVTDFASYYHLPSTIIGNDKHKILRAVYAYYNVPTTMSMKDLMKDALTLAKNEQVDVFNALDLMENKEIFEDLKFGAGDGHLQYYLYNWKCPEIASEETGLVLL